MPGFLNVAVELCGQPQAFAAELAALVPRSYVCNNRKVGGGVALRAADSWEGEFRNTGPVLTVSTETTCCCCMTCLSRCQPAYPQISSCNTWLIGLLCLVCLLLWLLLGTACLQCVGLDLDSEAAAAAKACTRCRTARYCCVDCQAANWKPLHKATCSRLKAARAAAPAAQAAF